MGPKIGFKGTDDVLSFFKLDGGYLSLRCFLIYVSKSYYICVHIYELYYSIICHKKIHLLRI